MLQKIISLRVTPPDRPASTGYDRRIDSLRGFAAWSVMVVHGFGYDGLDDPSPLSAPNEYIRHLHLSRAAVLLFFITSGYVIGLTNQGPFSSDRAFAYLRKRCLRIVPLYVFAIVAGWLAYRAVAPGKLLANLLFLQNSAWDIQPLAGNRPVWSLHYEAVYYLGFLLLWAYRPRLLILIPTLLLLTLGDWFIGGPLSFLGGWSAGGLFWLTGLLLAWYRPTTGDVPVVSFVLLTYATNHLWPATILLHRLGFPYGGTAAMWLADLALLPGTLVVFCAVARLNFRGLVVAKWLACLIPAGTCGLLAIMGRLWENVPWTMASLAVAVALPLLVFERAHWSDIFFRLFRPLGKISYGLYLLHLPCVTLTIWLYPWNGKALNYLGGVATWLTLTVVAAWLAEMKLQPAVVAAFKARSAAPAKIASPTE